MGKNWGDTPSATLKEEHRRLMCKMNTNVLL